MRSALARVTVRPLNCPHFCKFFTNSYFFGMITFGNSERSVVTG